MVDNKRALIVGGGVAGPVLAIFLQRAGFLPEVFEASSGPSTAGGALGLAANGMHVLRAAGLAEPVRDVSVTGAEWAFENQSGRVLACLSSITDAERYGQAPVMITRSALHDILVNRAQEAGIAIHHNRCLTSLDDTPGHPVRLTFADRSSAEGDFVVGADGIRSAVRQLVLPGAPRPEYTGMMAPGGFSPCLDPDVRSRSNQRVHFVFGRKGFFGYFNALTHLGPRTVWWSTSASPLASKEQVAAETRSDLRQRLLTLHRNWAQPVPRLIETSEEILNIAIHDVPSLPTWSVGRTVLIGDAAHAVAPHSGQGASMALEDAQLLAKLLRDARGQTIQKSFAEFEKQRLPRTDRVIAIGRRNAQRKETLSPIAYWIQQQMIRIFVPLSKRKKEDWLYGFRVQDHFD